MCGPVRGSCPRWFARVHPEEEIVGVDAINNRGVDPYNRDSRVTVGIQ
jgi:hypothetical protein